jgi:predicted site-specific integrase-resolvase
MKRASKLYTLAEAAALIGIAPVTLKRWLLSARVADVARDRNNWRRFTEEDIARIREFADRTDPPKSN